MLRQFFSEAETHAHAMAEPDQCGGEQTPHREDHGEAEDDRQPFVGRQHHAAQLFLGQVELVAPAVERAVGTGELLFEVGEGPADQAEYAFFGAGLGLFGRVAQLLQVGQQLRALLVVFQRLDDFVEGLAERFLGFGLRLVGVEQARQTDRVGGRHRQQCHQADKEQTGQSKKTSEH
ncbi:hypothetical protein D3C87_1220680 [compost metagenome]